MVEEVCIRCVYCATDETEGQIGCKHKGARTLIVDESHFSCSGFEEKEVKEDGRV